MHAQLVVALAVDELRLAELAGGVVASAPTSVKVPRYTFVLDLAEAVAGTSASAANDQYCE